MFILRLAWLNLLDKHMTTGRINQVAIVTSPAVRSTSSKTSQKPTTEAKQELKFSREARPSSGVFYPTQQTDRSRNRLIQPSQKYAPRIQLFDRPVQKPTNQTMDILKGPLIHSHVERIRTNHTEKQVQRTRLPVCKCATTV